MAHRGVRTLISGIKARLGPHRLSFRLDRAQLPAILVLLVATAAGLLMTGSTGAGDAEAQTPALTQRGGIGGPDSSLNIMTFERASGRSDETDGGNSETRRGAPAAPARSGPAYAFAWPAAGAISQGMSAAHPAGIDIGAGIGDPIWAVRDGTVTFVGGDPCCVYGNYVVVEHGDGWSSLYGHLSAFRVKEGDAVKQGDVLGLAGNTGQSSGPHLHFELRKYGGVVNPLDYLEPARYWVPVYVAAEPRTSSAEGPSTPTPEPEPEPATVSQSQAIDAAVRWMEGAAGDYLVQRGTCFAIAAGPNWSVACTATELGCSGDRCTVMLEACVVGGYVEAACTGY